MAPEAGERGGGGGGLASGPAAPAHGALGAPLEPYRLLVRVVHAAEPLQLHHGGAFVPTMGALHDGHAALIRRARELARPVVVSIFVNPTQFGPSEDFSRYPRTLEADCFVCEQAGAEIVFAPAVETIYPPAATSHAPVPPLPPVATAPKLEDAARPTHFAGVCQVVARLFDLVRPSAAIFGEKDWQQLKVIEAMVAATAQREPRRWGSLQVVPHATVREADGLAMSSRNRYLRPEQRELALGLVRSLQMAASAQRPATAERLMRETLTAHGLLVDYAVVRDPATLLPVDSLDRPTRALVAARLDSVRLIDNAGLPAIP